MPARRWVSWRQPLQPRRWIFTSDAARRLDAQLALHHHVRLSVHRLQLGVAHHVRVVDCLIVASEDVKRDTRAAGTLSTRTEPAWPAGALTWAGTARAPP